MGIFAATSVALAADPIDIGSRLELFVDDFLIDTMHGARRRLQHPIPREIALDCDRPWEGNESIYVTVFRDGEIVRMYYRGRQVNYSQDGLAVAHPEVVCYAESKDGIHWERPNLGMMEFNGSKQNNIIWNGLGVHNFVPFKDPNPGCKPGERYKALAGAPLHALKSADGIHWSLMGKDPVITRGDFDSQNLAFWDSVRGEYRAYYRKKRGGRDIMTCTSKDFLNWTDPVFLDYSPGRISELYTNQIIPYDRAPHIFLGFPTRYLDRGWTESTRALPQLEYRKIRGAKSPREGTALTDGMFMSSRDAVIFDIWPESFIRPGLRLKDNWFYGDNYQNWGLIETKSAMEGAPNELSIFVSESALQGKNVIYRRHTLRIDGFVSVEAPLSGGWFTTHPIRFTGRQLVLNFATSAAGTVRVEIQDDKGAPIPGFTLGDSALIYGDELARAVSWKGDPDLGKLEGKAVRLRFELNDADIYSIQFRDE